jgi:hypothetical protein
MTVRLRADAGPLRDSVLAAARRARREQLCWRWTWAAAAVVFAVAIPVNLSLDRCAVPTSRTSVDWPPELRHLVRLPFRGSAASHPIPRSVEELR